MIEFYTHNSEGRILSAGYCPENMFDLQQGDGIFVSEGAADVSKQYVSEGALVDKPIRPSKQHVFNYQTKTWEDPRSLEDFRQAAYKAIEEWRDTEENKEFVFYHAGRSWDAGLITRQRLQPVVNLSQLPDGFFWTDSDNLDVPLDMASLQLLAQAHEEALVIKVFEIHAQQRAMKNAVAAATTKEQVQSIVIGYSSQ